MIIGIEAQLLIIEEIKRINKIADYQVRVDELVKLRKSVVSNLFDELDDMLAEVDLTKKEHNRCLIENKIIQMSIAFDEEQQARMDYELLCDNVSTLVNELYWYDRQILMLYIDLGNYRAIQKKTGIPYASAYKTVQKVIKEIKQKVLR